MSTPPPSRKNGRPSGFTERRAPEGSPGSLRWLKGLWGRPLEVVREGADLRLRVVERRKSRDTTAPPSSRQLRQELRARLSACGHGHAAHAMRHLIFVYEELRRKGWTGVEALPAAVRDKAVIQAEMLLGGEPLPALADFVHKLRQLQQIAARRASQAAASAPLEVSEVTHEEFEAMERSWAGHVPPGLLEPDRTPR